MPSTICTQALIFAIVFASCQLSMALSTVTQLTRTVLQSNTNIVIHAARKEGDHLKFEVKFFVPRGFNVSDSISSHLEIRIGEEFIAESRVGWARPAALAQVHRSAGMKAMPLVFSFAVKREHLATSKFSLSHLQPDAARADDYWFYLRDFVRER